MKHVLRLVGSVLVAIGAFAFGGCSVFDPAEEIPSYLRINSIGLTINNSSVEGTASHKITDAWVYVDGQLIGGFEMPVNIPVLAEGPHQVLVLAGIKQNGQSSTRAIYPYYKGWESTVTFTRGQSVVVSPVVEYYPTTNFMWMCDFDGAGTTITELSQNRMTVISGASAFEGESAYVTLNADTNEFYAHSSFPMAFNGSYDVYLELNYKCNQNFVIGLYNATNGNFIPWCDVSESQSWNKIYIRLNDAILTQQPGGNYHVYIAMKKSSSVANPWLAFDEIKLIN